MQKLMTHHAFINLWVFDWKSLYMPHPKPHFYLYLANSCSSSGLNLEDSWEDLVLSSGPMDVWIPLFMFLTLRNITNKYNDYDCDY